MTAPGKSSSTAQHEAANRNVRLIKTGAASQHAGIDTGCIHHADMRAEIGKQRIEQIMRIAVAIEIGRCFARFTFEQFRRRVMLLKIDEHLGPVARMKR